MNQKPAAIQEMRPTPVESDAAMRAARETVLDNSGWVGPLQTEMARVIVGQKHLLDRLLVALLTNGHVLLEGVPGLAKTLALKTLAIAIAVRFKRLQFTPDMLPADIVGTMIYNPQDGAFRTKQGPIFSNLILADEINRAPAKVQSALLEAMQERQVTIGDETYPLPNPFLVLATQNPLEQEGTYPLPEAQINRFMMKLLLRYPNHPPQPPIRDPMHTPPLGCAAARRSLDTRGGARNRPGRGRAPQYSTRPPRALPAMPHHPPKPTKSIMSGMRQLEIPTRRMVNDSLAGEYHSVFKGRGMDFDEVREYSPGDEVRTIDWNVTARAGRPFVKKFTEERELTILLLVDISASGNFGSAKLSKRDLAAQLTSVLAFSAIRNSDKVGLLLYTDRVERYLPPKKGRRHVLRVVRDILYHTPEGRGTDSVKALDVANHVLHRRAIVFLISDFQSPGDPARTRAALRRAMRQTNRRHDLIAVQVADPREKELPNVGVLALEDAETGEIIELDTGNAAVRRRYKELAIEHARRLVDDLRAEGVDTLELKTDSPYMPALQRFFKTRERRRV